MTEEEAMASKQSVDPNVRQAIERVSAMYKECSNKGDAAGVAGVFTKDGVLISQSPESAVKSCTQAIVQRYEGLFKSGFTKMDTRVGQVAQLGDDVAIAWGEYQFTGRGQKIGGTWSATYVRETGTWKCRLLNAIPKPPAPATK
jgi:uncharacterized protein (TIGR02246 family)